MDDDRRSALPTLAEPLVCARCDYRLEGLSTDGRCPECGLAIDDSIRAGGLWTLVRLRRFRTIVIAFVVAAAAWAIVVFLVAVVTPTHTLRAVVGMVGLVHTGCLLVGALGGAYAVSRQPRRVRVVVSALLSLLLVVAATVVGLGILRVIPLGNAMGAIALSVAALTRVSVVVVAATWLFLGLRLLEPRWAAQPALFMTTLALYVTVWLAAVGIMIASSTSAISLPSAERLIAGACFCDTALLVVMAGLLLPSLESARSVAGALESP